MFPFIIPLIREAVRYFQQDTGDCGGRGSAVPSSGPAPTTPQQGSTTSTPAHDSSHDHSALHFLRRLGSAVRRSFGPLRSPTAERVIREHAIPLAREGSMFLPRHMPSLSELSPADLAIELGVSVVLLPFGPLAATAGHLLSHGVQQYLGAQENAAALSGAGAGLAATAPRQGQIFRRVAGACQQPRVLECR